MKNTLLDGDMLVLLGNTFYRNPQQGDIIVGINGVKITDIATFRYQLYKYHGGDKIEVKYIRNGKEYTVQLTLEKNWLFSFFYVIIN